MKKALGNIADIYTGATLREKPSEATARERDALLMQLGDLDTIGNIQTHTMLPVELQAQFDKFVARMGDIVFRGRGAGIVAAVMPETTLPVVVASPLIIIRPDIRKVDPDYLVWALTADHARRFYAEHSRGSSIVGIGKRDLDLLEIDLPSLDIQKKIAQLKKLEVEEQHLLTRYQKAKARLVEAMIIDTLHKEKAA